MAIRSKKKSAASSVPAPTPERYTYLVESSINTLLVGTTTQIEKLQKIRRAREMYRLVCYGLMFFFALGSGTLVGHHDTSRWLTLVLSLMGIVLCWFLAAVFVPYRAAKRINALDIRGLDPPILLPITAFNGIDQADRHEVATRIMEMSDEGGPDDLGTLVKILGHLRSTSTQRRRFE